MYVEIVGNSETKTYDDVRNISFAPQTDVIGASLPINEFAVDVYTNDTIRNGFDIYLYDDEDNLWAKYWIVYAERMDEYFVRVRAQSKLVLLDRIRLPETMYEGDSVSTVIGGIFNPLSIEEIDTQPVVLDSSEYSIDSSLASETITGYCPRQTARERLLWVCFVIGAYVKTYFTDVIEIASLEDVEGAAIPINKTYWRPTVSYADYVTAVSVVAYTITEDDPLNPSGSKDQIFYNGANYNVTRQIISLNNSDAPQTAPTNIVSIEDVMLINPDNADDILARMAQYYFDRTQVDLEAIDNAEFVPGQRLIVCADQENMVAGYAERCYFSFGTQAKASIHLASSASIETGTLVLLYKYGTKQVGKNEYTMPVGVHYEFQTEYIDSSYNKHRYIFRPTQESVSGALETTGKTTVTIPCLPALDLDKQTEVLYIIDVDSPNALVIEGVEGEVIGGGGDSGSGESSGTTSGESSEPSVDPGETPGGETGGETGGEPQTPYLTKIAVTKNITEYNQGVYENINYDGLEVTATYSDGHTANVTNNCTFDPPEGTQGLEFEQYYGKEQTVNISYTEDGVTKTTQAHFVVIAWGFHPVKISVDRLPTKTSYSVGETLDLAGLKIKITLQPNYPRGSSYRDYSYEEYMYYPYPANYWPEHYKEVNGSLVETREWLEWEPYYDNGAWFQNLHWWPLFFETSFEQGHKFKKAGTKKIVVRYHTLDQNEDHELSYYEFKTSFKVTVT